MAFPTIQRFLLSIWLLLAVAEVVPTVEQVVVLVVIAQM